jgi:hypothetical protein
VSVLQGTRQKIGRTFGIRPAPPLCPQQEKWSSKMSEATTTEAPAKKQTLTERFKGKTVKSFTGYTDEDFTDPENPQSILEKIDIIFDDDTKLTVSAEYVGKTIKVRPMISPFDIGPEEPMQIKSAKLVCK